MTKIKEVILAHRYKVSIVSVKQITSIRDNPVWTYGIQLCGNASNSSMEVLQRYQNKVLRIIVNAPRYAPNNQISRSERANNERRNPKIQ